MYYPWLVQQYVVIHGQHTCLDPGNMAEKGVSYQNCNTSLDIGTDDVMSNFPPFFVGV